MVLYNPLILFPILLIAVVVYYLLPSSWRRYFLLILSLSFFYSFSPKGTLLLFLLTVFNYFIAIVIQRSQKKHFFRCIAILINITAFTIPRLIEAGAAAKLSISLDYLIPLGIAFFTLQNIGYVLDVSRGIICFLYYFLPNSVQAPSNLQGISFPRSKMNINTILVRFTGGFSRFYGGYLKR